MPTRKAMQRLAASIDEYQRVLMETMVGHAEQTSPSIDPREGHNQFSIESSPDGSFLRCHVCQKCLPLP
jgi:hypothetical protein